MVGEIVNHYKILEKLGGGGMGVVYNALDLKLDRHVALKFLPPVFSLDDEFKQNIIREAKVAAKLEHPNICNIHDVGETSDGQIFIVMAFYEGETLKKKIKKNSLETHQIHKIAREIAKGLREAHNKGIVHRDIKPDNIFITKSNEVKILDFGVAKLEGDFSVLDSDQVKGTIGYMSPEQIKGQEVDHRTDIWSFGVLLYELLAGEKPFSSQFEQSALYSIVNDDPDMTKIADTGHQNELKEIIELCLRKKREDRFQSVDEILQKLESTKKQYKKKLNTQFTPTLISGLLLGIVILASLISYFNPIQDFLFPDKHQLKKLAIVPFSSSINSGGDEDFSLILQNLIANNLVMSEKIAIVDPISLNGFLSSASNSLIPTIKGEIVEFLQSIEVDYYLSGNIKLSNNKYFIGCNVVETRTSQIILPINKTFNTETGIGKIAKVISDEIFDFFQIRQFESSGDRNIDPMIKGTNNIAALKAFIIATEHIYRLDTREAIKYLRESISLDSSFVSPRIWLVSYLYQMGSIEEAKYHLEISKKYESKCTLVEQIMIGWAEAFVNNDLKRQIHFLEMGLKYFPQNSIALYQIAGVYSMQGNYSEALKYYEQILKMKWPFSTAYSNMAYCQLMLDRNDEAIEVLDFALDIEPMSKDIYLLFEIAYKRIGEKEKAKKYQNLYSQKIISLGISEKEGLENSATTKQDLGEIEDAISDYEQIVNIDPDDYNAIEKIGDLYLIKLDTTAALHNFERILLDEELNPPVNLKMARIYDARKDTVSALKYYNNYIIANPSKQDTSILERIYQLKK